jgi:hypothetical protein
MTFSSRDEPLSPIPWSNYRDIKTAHCFELTPDRSNHRMFEKIGFSDLDTAKKCFNENLQDYVDVQKDPHLGNLYIGLFKMASALEQMQSDIATIKATLSKEQQ